MGDGLSWPDVEEIVVAYLESVLTGVEVASSTPDRLEGKSFVKVTVQTGTDDGITDRAMVDVQAFAPSRAGAQALAEDCRNALHDLAARAVSDDGTSLVDRVQTSLRPAWVDYKNPRVHRFVASYWLTTRAQ